MLDLKRGDTLSYSGFLPVGWLPAGTWSVLCKAQDKKTLAKFVITAALVAPTGGETRYLLKLYAAPSLTATFPAGKMNADLQFTDSSASPDPFVFSSSTFILNMIPDVA